MSREPPQRSTYPLVHLVALRVVIASSIVDVILIILILVHWGQVSWMPWYMLLPILVVVLHHFGRYEEPFPNLCHVYVRMLTTSNSALGPGLFPIRIWMDIALTLFETACRSNDIMRSVDT